MECGSDSCITPEGRVARWPRIGAAR
jgi:hypothetical protein